MIPVSIVQSGSSSSGGDVPISLVSGVFFVGLLVGLLLVVIDKYLCERRNISQNWSEIQMAEVPSADASVIRHDSV